MANLRSTIVLVDAGSDSLTVSWPNTSGTTRYELQYRKATLPLATGKEGEAQENAMFQCLSDKLVGTQARKKNLTDEDHDGFFFRVGSVIYEDRVVTSRSWKYNYEPFFLLSPADEARRMAAPIVSHTGKHESLLIRWTAFSPKEENKNTSSSSEHTGYELQMREFKGGESWATIAPNLTGTEVVKKKLPSKTGYQFRVRPKFRDEDSKNPFPFSPPSEPVVAYGLSDGIKKLFSCLDADTLLKSFGNSIDLPEALGGKEFILIYVSASWCGPCKQFSPKLAEWYKRQDKSVEIVFLSADHKIADFGPYYRQMPWLAVDYDDDAREELMQHFQVKSIPQLVVLCGRTGRILEQNAYGKELDVDRWRGLAKSEG